jgi:hypothetical protein
MAMNAGWSKSFEEIGEAAVEARITEGGYAPPINLIAREWLYQRRMQRETVQRERELSYIRHTAQASWFLAIVTIIIAGISYWGIWSQKEDAHTLLSAQISVEMDKQFDSPEMRRARSRLAAELLGNKEVTETRLYDFFDKVGMYTHQDLIDQNIVYPSYSYWVERYWPAVKSNIEKFRKEENDSGYYQDFEDLNDDMLSDDAKETGKSVSQVTPNESEIHRFLIEESTLSQ